jgi:NADPH2:quinone reductase
MKRKVMGLAGGFRFLKGVGFVKVKKEESWIDRYACKEKPMKAIRLYGPGGPEALVYEDVPDPRPSPSEAVVALKAASVNYLDLWVRKGNVPVLFPLIPGLEGAGVIEAFSEPDGPSPGLKAGDRVAVTPWLYPDKTYREPANLGVTTLGVHRDGCYAAKIAVPIEALIPIPEGMGFEEAACIPVAFTTAYHMLVTRARLEPGETVLILGATGGVGIASVQLASLLGARVFAASRDPIKAQRLKALGVHVLLDASSAYHEEVLELTGGKGVDLVVEMVGQASFAKSIACLRKGGRLVVCGSSSGPWANVNIQELYRREIAFIGAYGGLPHELERVFTLFEGHKFKAVIGETLPLKDAPKAHALLESSGHFGKVVLTMDDET